MEINDKEKQVLTIKLLIEEAYRGISERKKRIKDLNKQLRKLTGEDGLPWTEKSVECIRLFNEVVSTDEILRCIFSNRMDELADSFQRKGYITGLSVALNKLCKAGKLKNIKVKGVRGLMYGLPEWWNDNNELDTFYKYTLKNKIDRIENKKPPGDAGGK